MVTRSKREVTRETYIDGRLASRALEFHTVHANKKVPNEWVVVMGNKYAIENVPGEFGVPGVFKMYARTIPPVDLHSPLGR